MSKHMSNRLSRTVLLLLVSVATSFAHPMGNFSVNHYAKITISQGYVEIRYLLDMAEIPTFQEIRQLDITPTADAPGTYLARQEQLLKAGISLESDGQSVLLDTISRQAAYAGGVGGLPTMKIGMVFRGKLDVTAGAHKLSYSDNNFSGRAGWKEVVVLGEGVAILDSSAPGTDRSQELTNYSSDVLNSPPQQLSALVGFRSTARQALAIQRQRHRSVARSSPSNVLASTVAPLSFPAHAPNTPRSRFTELISTQGKLSLWVLISAALIAAGLGALHALEQIGRAHV